jgi:KDO2-lipid IV(A) lauroyltransferase
MAINRGTLLIGLIRTLGKLSLPAAQRLGRAAGWLMSHLPTRARKVTITNLLIAFPELDDAARRRLLHDSLSHTGQTALEIPLIWEWPVERCLELVREIDGEEHLEAARAGGRGLILLSPHLGNWELCGLYFSSRYRMAALYSPPHIEEFEDYMSSVRGRLGSRLVRGDRRGLAHLIGLLREGEVTGILPDQSPRGAGMAYAPFFGMTVRTMTLVGKLIQKSGAVPLMTWCQRRPDGQGFTLMVRPCEPGMDDPDPVLATTALNRSVENCVRLAPAQYQWEYKRFRHREPGQPNPYNPKQLCR